MTLAGVRAAWLRRQRLTPGLAPATVEQCVRDAGWLAAAGAQGAYLSVRARMPGASRDAVDRAAVDGKPLIETIGPRGTAYLVPRDDAALALRSFRPTFQKQLAGLFRTGEISEPELRGLGAAICRVLEEAPLATAEIRKAVRHPRAGELGEGARRAGLPDGVALALRDLTVRGMIRRFPADGRLDSAKYAFELLHPDDRIRVDEGDDAEVARRLVERFLSWNGPATVDEVAWWADLTKTAARAALRAARAESLRVAGWTDEAWMLGADAADIGGARRRASNRVLLIPFRDPYVYARRGPAVLCPDPTSPVLDWKSKRAVLGDVDSLHHHAILHGAELVGVWEYDPDDRVVVTRVWSRNRSLRALAARAAEQTGVFVREQLGDVKFYAFDTGLARKRRLAFCRRE